jgi:hypothetical protein
MFDPPGEMGCRETGSIWCHAGRYGTVWRSITAKLYRGCFFLSAENLALYDQSKMVESMLLPWIS